jgi:integrase-like protein
VTGRLRRESPWQNGHAERLIGSIRRDCLDYVVVFGNRHLCHLLKSYQKYYNESRTHLSLSKDAPVSRGVQAVGHILCLPILRGLHHQYVRIPAADGGEFYQGQLPKARRHMNRAAQNGRAEIRRQTRDDLDPGRQR